MNIKELNQKQISFHKAINDYLQFADGKYSFENISKIYQELSSFNFQKEAESLDIKKYQGGSRDIEFLQKQIQDKEYIEYFFVHGSYATGDFVKNWSDLDTIVVLNKKVFEDRNVFNQASNFFRKISLICHRFDLLAHHRFNFITGFDLSYYPQMFLPMIVYQEAIDLKRKYQKIQFKIREDDFEKKEVLKDSLAYLKKISQRGKITYFQFKKALSIALMIPSLLLQEKNIYILKKDSFVRVRKEFPDLDFEVIDQVSEKRKNWQLPYGNTYLTRSMIAVFPDWLNQLIHRIILYPYTHFQVANELKDLNAFLEKINGKI